MNKIESYRPKIWVGVLPVLVVLLTGCFFKQVVWSPDGTQAVVLSEKGLYLCDTNGALSDLLISNVVAAAWFPDSKRLAIGRAVAYSSWDKMAAELPAERRDRIVDEAKQTLAAFKAGATEEQAKTGIKDNEAQAVALYLKSVPGVRTILGTNWTEIETNETALEVFQIATVFGGKVSMGPILAKELDGGTEIRVAPNGKAIAYVIDTAIATTGQALKVASVDPQGPALVVDTQTCQFPDWTADGRSLVYTKAVGVVSNQQDLCLGSLNRRGVVNAAGALEVDPKPDEMAALIFDVSAKVRCLADGRILFSGIDVHLPGLAGDMPKRQQLFTVQPGNSIGLKALIPPQDFDRVPQETSLFEVDPTGRRVSLVDQGLVVILDLATGALESVKNPGSDPGTIPVWRTADELCYVTSPPNKAPAQLALWSHGQARIISTNWPAEARKGILDN